MNFTTQTILGVILIAGCYPLTLAVRYLTGQGGSSKVKLKRRWKRTLIRGRVNSCPDAYFAGLDALTGEPVLIDDESRMMHTQIVGVTGSSKTEGGILPPLLHDISWGRGAIIIDMKGDVSLLDKIWTLVVQTGRWNDFYYFSLAWPELSDPYNPLVRGNPSEIKDKIISSYIWTEEFYKKTSEMAVLSVCNAFKKLKRPVTFQALRDVLKDIGSIRALGKELEAQGQSNDTATLAEILSGSTKALAGLLADFTNIVDSDFGPLVAQPAGKIDLLDAYKTNKIVFFQLPTGLYQETAVRFARIVIQDIKTVSNFIQAYIPENERHFFPVFIDEFASIAFPAFIELLNKARSSKMAITIAHQSLGDLNCVDEHYKTQVFENTNNRQVFRQNDPDSVNLLTAMAGTVEDVKMTYQTDALIGANMPTGMGSSRVVERFRIDPNIIRALPRGYCVFMEKSRDRILYVQTDYIEFSSVRNFMQDRKKQDLPKIEKPKPVVPKPVPTPPQNPSGDKGPEKAPQDDLAFFLEWLS